MGRRGGEAVAFGPSGRLVLIVLFGSTTAAGADGLPEILDASGDARFDWDVTDPLALGGTDGSRAMDVLHARVVALEDRTLTIEMKVDALENGSRSSCRDCAWAVAWKWGDGWVGAVLLRSSTIVPVGGYSESAFLGVRSVEPPAPPVPVPEPATDRGANDVRPLRRHPPRRPPRPSVRRAAGRRARVHVRRDRVSVHVRDGGRDLVSRGPGAGLSCR